MRSLQPHHGALSHERVLRVLRLQRSGADQNYAVEIIQRPQSRSAELVFFVILITLCGGLGGWRWWMRHAGEIAAEGPWQRVPPDISALHRVGALGEQPAKPRAAESANAEDVVTVATAMTTRSNIHSMKHCLTSCGPWQRKLSRP